MSEHTALIRWNFTGGEFLKGKYSREHTWTFDGGLTVPAAPAPGNVPVAFGNPANLDPEEAFVAAVSSCHMLTFLFVAYRAGFAVESYEDAAVGVMQKNQRYRVALRRRILGLIPLDHRHDIAHDPAHIFHRRVRSCRDVRRQQDVRHSQQRKIRSRRLGTKDIDRCPGQSLLAERLR